MKTLFFKEEDGSVTKHSLHDVDAAHALEVDSEHWSAEDPSIAPSVVESANETDHSEGDK